MSHGYWQDVFQMPGGQGENAILAHIATSLLRIATSLEAMEGVMTRMVLDDGAVKVGAEVNVRGMPG